MLAIDFCQETVKGWRLVGLLIMVLRIMAPVIVIITSMIPFLDALVKGNSEGLFGAGKAFARKLAAALIIFFIPSVINSSIRLLANREMVDNNVQICSVCFDKPGSDECNGYVKKLDELIASEVEEFEEEELEGKVNTDELNDNVKPDPSTDPAPETTPGTDGGTSTTPGGTTSPAGSTTSNVKGTSNIIIGDSRTVQMCATFTGDWSGCGTGAPRVNGNDVYVAKGAMGYSWFESTAIPNTNSILSSNNGTTYNIFSLMGVNFLLYDIDKYIPKYNELADGAWSKHRIILVSANPVNEAVEAQYGYSTKNSDIELFNSKLKAGTSGKKNISYCDVYNQIKGNFGTGDGLHYDGNTYKAIYNAMMNCV